MTTSAATAMVAIAALAGCSAEEEGKGGGGGGGAGEGRSATTRKPLQRLEPAKPLTMAGQRYLSPCQLIDPALAQKTLGDDPGYEFQWEEYLDTSIPRPDLPADALRHVTPSCRYTYPDDSEVGVTVQAAENPGRFASDLDTGDAAEVLQNYSSLDDKLGDAASALLDDLRAGTVVLDERGNMFDDTAIFSYRIIHGRFKVTVDYQLEKGTVPSSGGAASEPTLNKEQRSDQLETIAPLISEVRRRITDQTLTQAPSPTRISGRTTFGTTPVVEVCEVYDRAIFSKVLNVPENDLISRRPAQEHDDRLASECEHGFQAGYLKRDLRGPEKRYGKGGYAYMAMRLDAYKDTATADRAWQESTQGDGKAVAVPGADAAVVFGRGSATFRVGDQVASLTFVEAREDAFLGDIKNLDTPPRKAVGAARLLAPRLRALSDAAVR